jgi:hypothetical protein
VKIVFSPKLMKPGCVLLQVAMGGDVPREQFFSLFPSDTWLVFPVDDMAAYPVTEEQLLMLAENVKP